MTMTDILQIQEYFRTKLAGQNASQDANNKRFFHEFHTDAETYEILPGHVKLLEKIISYINTMTESHGPEYFDPRIEKHDRKPASKVAVVRKSRVRGIRTIPQIFAQSSFVNVSNETIPITAPLSEILPQSSSTEPLPKESLGTAADADVSDASVGDAAVKSDGSLEKFILDERLHLIEIIRTWMQKNVPVCFEQYEVQLVPEILEAVTEKPKIKTENEQESIGENNVEENTGSSDVMLLIFAFCCPKCGKKIRSSQQSTKTGESYFSLSNVERHWKLHEPKKPKKTKAKAAVARKLRSKLGSKAISKCDVNKEVSNDYAEFEILTDEDTDNEGPGDFKIIKKSNS